MRNPEGLSHFLAFYCILHIFKCNIKRYYLHIACYVLSVPRTNANNAKDLAKERRIVILEIHQTSY